MASIDSYIHAMESGTDYVPVHTRREIASLLRTLKRHESTDATTTPETQVVTQRYETLDSVDADVTKEHTIESNQREVSQEEMSMQAYMADFQQQRTYCKSLSWEPDLHGRWVLIFEHGCHGDFDSRDAAALHMSEIRREKGAEWSKVHAVFIHLVGGYVEQPIASDV